MCFRWTLYVTYFITILCTNSVRQLLIPSRCRTVVYVCWFVAYCENLFIISPFSVIPIRGHRSISSYVCMSLNLDKMDRIMKYIFFSLKVDWCEKEFRFEKGDTIYFLCAIKILKQHRYDARKGLFYLTKFDKILNKYWLVWHRWNYDLYLPTCKVRYEITSTVTLNEWKTLS